MPKGNPAGYASKTGRDHPAAGRAPGGGGSGRGKFGREVIRQSVPRGTKPPNMGRDHAASNVPEEKKSNPLWDL